MFTQCSRIRLLLYCQTTGRFSMNPADTAFILICTTFVMLMTPALALFYGGLVRSKNILSTCMHSYAALGLVSIIWALVGYSLAFSGDISGIIGKLSNKVFVCLPHLIGRTSL